MSDLVRRSLRDELAFLLDSTVDLRADAYDRDTLLMRLECSFMARNEGLANTLTADRNVIAQERDSAIEAMMRRTISSALIEAERNELRKALESVWAAIGDALCSGNGIEKEYAWAVQRGVKAALTQKQAASRENAKPPEQHTST